MAADEATLALTKHEAAGNDFLVYLDPAGRRALEPELAQALCHRHLGVGADGLIRVHRGGEGLVMELRNGDGSAAEMSGNGIRAAAQAAVAGGLAEGPTVVFTTAAGPRSVAFSPGAQPFVAWASVDMGSVVLGAERRLGPPVKAATDADAGNPHLVLLVDDLAALDLAATAAAVAGSFPGGVNVEAVVRAGSDRLAMAVFERGVGLTLACGTGSCAAALAARRWGLVGDRVQVANPGGTLEVVMGEPTAAGRGEAASVTLSGPVRQVAEVRVGPALLQGTGRG